MNLKEVAILLAMVAVVEGFVLGYAFTANAQMSQELSSLREAYQSLQREYHKLTVPQYPVSIMDDAYRVVTISSEPRRIVSMAPAVTEILFALGVGSRVVGVTSYCDYPPEVQQLKNNGSLAIIGGFWDPNVELILSVKPDLVIGYSSVPSHIEVAERLEAMGVNVLLLFPRYLNDVLNNVELIGKATGRLEEARMLVYSMKERVNAITLKVKELEKVRVYYELWFAPLMSAGPGTFIDELITLARGENIFHDSGTSWPLVKDEDVITRDPQVIILPTTYMSDYNVTVDQIKSREGWSMISAVKDDRIYFVQEDLLVRPGPRMVDGLEALAEIIHPEAFKR